MQCKLTSYWQKSLNNRLMAIFIATISAALVMAGVALLINESVKFRDDLQHRLTILADITGANTRGALAFDDADSATKTLSSLRVYPHIRNAVLYRPDGSILAQYTNGIIDEKSNPPANQRAGFAFKDGYFHLNRQVEFDSEVIGTVYIRADLKEQLAYLKQYLLILAAILTFSLLIATVLSTRLQRSISQPILALANLAKQVSLEKDYSLRSDVAREDEIGALLDGFNHMLSQIEYRDANLEQQISDKTGEIQGEHDFIKAVINTVPSVLMVIDNETSTVSVANRQFYNVFRFLPEHMQASDVLSQMGLQQDLVAAIVASEPMNHFEQEIAGFDRSPMTITLSLIPMHSRREHLLLLDDITAQKRVEEALFAEKERTQVTLDSITDAVITTDMDSKITYLNPVAEKYTSWGNEQASGHRLNEVYRSFDLSSREPIDDPLSCYLRDANLAGWAPRGLMLNAEDSEAIIEESARLMRDKRDEPVGILFVFRDVTEIRGLITEISHQAAHDALTGLANRREFDRCLHEALHQVKAGNTEHVLLFLDLDRFKVVNDTCGHVAGDRLLCDLTKLMQGLVRKRDTLARLGGDEFGILLEDCSIARGLEIAEKIRNAIQKYQLSWEKHTLTTGVSIGVVPVSEECTDKAIIMSFADVACYAAKNAGRNRIHMYSETDTNVAQLHGEMLWVSKIQRALQEDRFFLCQQTIAPVSNPSSSGSHYEILLRMKDEKGEIIPPNTFLPAAERYGLMSKLDRWVLKATCQWLSDHPYALEQLELCSINLSALTLADEDFLDFIAIQFKRYKIPPAKIGFEITETAAIENFSSAQRFIDSIKAKGCRLALDDFGTGMSSFAYLKNLPADFLKIDGVFVKNMAEDEIDYAMVKSINEVAHVMGMKTVAEFVENDLILEKLKELGVDFAQGYGIAKPKPLENDSGWISATG